MWLTLLTTYCYITLSSSTFIMCANYCQNKQHPTIWICVCVELWPWCHFQSKKALCEGPKFLRFGLPRSLSTNKILLSNQHFGIRDLKKKEKRLMKSKLWQSNDFQSARVSNQIVGLLIVLSSACLSHILLNGVLMRCKDVCIRKCVAVCATTHTATHCR